MKELRVKTLTAYSTQIFLCTVNWIDNFNYRTIVHFIYLRLIFHFETISRKSGKVIPVAAEKAKLGTERGEAIRIQRDIFPQGYLAG